MDDRQVIFQVVHERTLWRDTGDRERFRTAWHEDGWLTATWFQGPADPFIEVSRAGFARGVSVLHVLGVDGAASVFPEDKRPG